MSLDGIYDEVWEVPLLEGEEWFGRVGHIFEDDVVFISVGLSGESSGLFDVLLNRVATLLGCLPIPLHIQNCFQLSKTLLY